MSRNGIPLPLLMMLLSGERQGRRETATEIPPHLIEMHKHTRGCLTCLMPGGLCSTGAEIMSKGMGINLDGVPSMIAEGPGTRVFRLMLDGTEYIEVRQSKGLKLFMGITDPVETARVRRSVEEKAEAMLSKAVDSTITILEL